MSTPRSTPKRPSRRSTPTRSPLSEHSASQRNESAGKLQRKSKLDLGDLGPTTTTPFPTKPQHILLPSTVRQQRSRNHGDQELPLLLERTMNDVVRSNSRSRRNERNIRRAPNLQLKKSVSTLRDIYEAQAERSRLSGARSTSRPSTSVSGARSDSSPVWPFNGPDLAQFAFHRNLAGQDLSHAFPDSSNFQDPSSSIDSEHSFASRVRHQQATSSPNFRTFASSSPALPRKDQELALQDTSTFLTSDPASMSSSNSLAPQTGSKQELGTDPTPFSVDPGDYLHETSSPNMVKLGTTSPQRSSSPAPSSASSGSRKRKRPDADSQSRPHTRPMAFYGRGEHVPSSPVSQPGSGPSGRSIRSTSDPLPSSPPEFDASDRQSVLLTSSPVYRVLHGSPGEDRSSIASAHTNLQSVLSSSPVALPPRPVVRAPDVNQFETLALQKRIASNDTTIRAQQPHQLSPITSVGTFEGQRSSSLAHDQPSFRIPSTDSALSEEYIDNLDTESIAPAQAYMFEHGLNNSQEHMISDADRQEAVDQLHALPREAALLSPGMGLARCYTYTENGSCSRLNSLTNSFDGRLQHMRSFVSRQDSTRSSARPNSSASYISTNMVPTWARHYYSGFYQDSFQYLYQSSRDLSYSVTQVQPKFRRESAPASMVASSGFETISTSSRSDLRASFTRSIRSSIHSLITTLDIKPLRPKLDARDSHKTAGLGPLVSNPVRPVSEMFLRPSSIFGKRKETRRLSLPLSAVDPRYHWKGFIDLDNQPPSSKSVNPLSPMSIVSPTTKMSQRNLPLPPEQVYADAQRMRLSTPHLHHDRLHTGSSASHGYGAPYNNRPRWQPSQTYTDQIVTPSFFRMDRRDFQVISFMTGFLLPFMWFIAALTPLPKRPMTYHDLEKCETSASNYPPSWSEADIHASLRLERHLRGLEEVRWQNARWWRTMNRWMSSVGLVILVVVIVLAVIGTRGDFR